MSRPRISRRQKTLAAGLAAALGLLVWALFSFWNKPFLVKGTIKFENSAAESITPGTVIRFAIFDSISGDPFPIAHGTIPVDPRKKREVPFQIRESELKLGIDDVSQLNFFRIEAFLDRGGAPSPDSGKHIAKHNFIRGESELEVNL